MSGVRSKAFFVYLLSVPLFCCVVADYWDYFQIQTTVIPSGAVRILNKQENLVFDNARYVKVDVLVKEARNFTLVIEYDSGSDEFNSWIDDSSFKDNGTISVLYKSTNIRNTYLRDYYYSYGEHRWNYHYRGLWNNIKVTLKYDKCEETEAKEGDGFEYIYPSDSVVKSEGTIINSDTIGWKYDSFRNANACPCYQWQFATSFTSSDVWSGNTPTSTYCNAENSTETTYAVSFGDSYDGKWFWFGVRQVGKSGKTTKSSDLPVTYICPRRSKTYRPTLIPDSTLVFFSNSARVKASWDRSQFNSERCGEKQEVRIRGFINEQNGYLGAVAIDNGDYVSVPFRENGNIYIFLLEMGDQASNWWDGKQLSKKDCRFLSNNRWSVSDGVKNETFWSVKMNFDWGCNQYYCPCGFMSNALYVFTFNAVDANNRAVTISEMVKNYSGGTYDSTFSATALKSYFTKYGCYRILGTLSISVYYNVTNDLIAKAEEKTHLFCDITPPGLSATTVDVFGSTVCERAGERKTLILSLPSATPGTTCEDPVPLTKELYELFGSTKTKILFNGSTVDVTVDCPSEFNKNNTYQYEFRASNDQKDAFAYSKYIDVCLNQLPAKPLGLKVNSEDGSNLVVVNSSEATIILSWDGVTRWGNCKTYSSMQKWYELRSNYISEPNEVHTESYKMAVSFTGNETKKTIQWEVRAVRDENYPSEYNSHSFIICKKTPPGAPEIEQRDGIILENNYTFRWKSPQDKGENCENANPTLDFFFNLYNQDGSVVENYHDKDVSGLEELPLDVTPFVGRYTWNIKACIHGGGENLCRLSANGTVNFDSCFQIDPSSSPSDSAFLKPEMNDELFLNNTGNASIVLEWRTPNWGTICYDKSMKRNMFLSVKNSVSTIVTSFHDVESSERIHQYELFELATGEYFWTVESQTVFEGSGSEPRRESNLTRTTESRFRVCVYTVPRFELSLYQNSEGHYVAEESNGFLPLVFSSQKVEETCQGTISVIVSVRLPEQEAIEKKFVLEPQRNGQEMPMNVSYTSKQLHPFSVSVSMTTSLYQTTMSRKTSYQLCVPREPPPIDVTVEKVNQETGEIQASWTGWMNEVKETGCYNRLVVFDYNITYRSDDGRATVAYYSTDLDVISFYGNQSGLYTIDISVNNGYFTTFGTSKSIYLCLVEDLGSIALKSPETGTSPWYENVVFQYEKLAGAEEMCTQLSYELILKNVDNDSSQVIPLSAGSESVVFGNLEKGTNYEWSIRRNTSQLGSEYSSSYSFSTCDSSEVVINEVQLVFPIKGEYVSSSGSGVELSWAVQTSDSCTLRWRYEVRIWKESEPDNVLSYYANSDRYVVTQLDGSDNNGTTYCWNLTALNVDTNVEKSSLTETFKYCECQRPGVPVQTYPKSTILRSGGGFFVSRIVDPGRSCQLERNETKAVVYKARIESAEGNVTLEYESQFNDTTRTTDDDFDAVKIGAITKEVPYGFVRWTVTATNDAGLTTTSNTVQFYVCDYASQVELRYPNHGANTSDVIVFKWNPNSVVFGYPCDGNIRASEELHLYVEHVNDTTNESKVIFNTGIGKGTTEVDATDNLSPQKGFIYQHHYKWYMVISNNEMTLKSEENHFYANILTCKLLDCQNGGRCDNATGVFLCICPGEYSGDRCQYPKEVNVGLIVGTSVGAFFVFSIITGIIVFALIRKRRREARKRVTLKGPVKDLRFSNVKVAGTPLSNDEMEKLRERLCDDAENGGFALSIAILGSTPSTNIENTCKALLYAHHHDHNDVMLMKALIRREVSTSVKSDVIFRANTAATLTFKHLSKMVGLNYLFATLGKVVRDVIQKDADDTAVEERMKNDKNLSELMVMQDTFEVDPTKLDEGGQDDLLSINSIQLTLLVQRFVKHIFQSADKMPAELHEVMAEVKNTVGSAFPDAVQCALSAFLFLRFFNCGIAVPESYGLLEEPPNERIRRSLVLATKVLTTMTSGAHFGDKEEFMTQFNELIDKNQKELAAFYEAVCNEAEGESSEFMDTPSDIYKNSMNVIACYEKEVNGAAQDGQE